MRNPQPRTLRICSGVGPGIYPLSSSNGWVDRFLKQRYADRGLPEFRVTVGLHSGPVTLAKLRDPITGAPAQTLLVGETVGLAMRLQQQADPLHWVVTASTEVLGDLGDAASTRGSASIGVPGRSKGMDVREVISIRSH